MGKSIREVARAQERDPGSLSELIHQHVRIAIETAVHEELRAALVGSRSERGLQFFVHGHLDRDADVLVDQLAEGAKRVLPGVKRVLLRAPNVPGTLAHGAFLRWPSARAAGW